ncbi:MAG: hypothetical protein IPK20_25935 [Betaproteobacteria bacterium]|nr:hypothetical protein [Betaproteobacteria bacterium]
MDRIERIVLLAALVLLAIACFVVLRPFLSAVLWAGILALATWPIFCRVRSQLGGRSNIAAGVMTTVFILVLVLPLALGGIAIAQHADPWIMTRSGTGWNPVCRCLRPGWRACPSQATGCTQNGLLWPRTAVP